MVTIFSLGAELGFSQTNLIQCVSGQILKVCSDDTKAGSWAKVFQITRQSLSHDTNLLPSPQLCKYQIGLPRKAQHQTCNVLCARTRNWQVNQVSIALKSGTTMTCSYVHGPANNDMVLREVLSHFTACVSWSILTILFVCFNPTASEAELL